MSTSNHPVEHEELMAYLDGELESGRAAEAAEHLEQCPQCRQLAADLREVSEMVAAWRVEEGEREPARNVVEAFEKRAAEKPTSPSVPWTWHGLINPFRWPKPVWGLAGIILALGLVITLKRPEPGVEYSTIWPKSGGAQQRPLQGLQDNRGLDNIKTPKAEVQKSQLESRAQVYNYDSLNKVRQPATPSATPGAGTAGKLDDIEANEQEDAELQDNPSNVPAAKGPMIIRTAELEVTTDAFDKARPALEEILKRHRGWVGELNIETPAGSARSLSGTLRVPSDQLEATLSDLKGLGRTEKEAQGGQEVTAQYVDLEARLANSKHTEQRLVEMLRDRSGKLSDVLAVEMQISRVRGEIEQMEAQRKTMKNQVDYATISVTVGEAYKAELNAVPPTTGTRFRNAAIEGYRALVDGIISVLLWLLSAGPSLLVWAAILFFPARYAWKRLRPRFVQK